MPSIVSPRCILKSGVRPHTSYSTNRTAPAIVINNGGIALDSTIHGEIATEACVCDLLVFKYSDSYFHGFDGTCTVVQEGHGRLRSTRRVLEDWI